MIVCPHASCVHCCVCVHVCVCARARAVRPHRALQISSRSQAEPTPEPLVSPGGKSVFLSSSSAVKVCKEQGGSWLAVKLQRCFCGGMSLGGRGPSWGLPCPCRLQAWEPEGRPACGEPGPRLRAVPRQLLLEEVVCKSLCSVYGLWLESGSGTPLCVL